jgi:drug/metabolite transporter (DMT)-like permease
VTSQALPFILLQGFLWGTSLLASRYGVGQFHPTVFAGLRQLLASGAYLLVYLVSGGRRHLPRDVRLWRHAAVLGTIGTAAPMTCIISSMQYQSATVTSILLTAGPVITIVMAHFTLSDETLNRRKGLGAMIALGGACLLAARGESGLAEVGRADPLGYALVFLGMLFAGAASIYARRFMREMNTLDVASVRMFSAATLVLPLAVLSAGIDLQAVDTQGYLALAYAAVIGTFVAMGLSFYIVQRFGATAQATALYVTPVVTGLGGVLLLDEQITAGMAAGLGLVAVGLALIRQKGGDAAPAADNEADSD